MISYPLFLLLQFLSCIMPGTVTAGSSEAIDNVISVATPVERIVYQRDNQNHAIVPVRGTCRGKLNYVEARLVARQDAQGVSTSWKKIPVGEDGRFDGYMEAAGGWYRLEIRGGGRKAKKIITVVERVGVGEVFIAVGHSVAQGGEINADGSADDRVSTIALDEKSERFDKKYLTTGDPQYLPEPVFVQAATGVTPAPFGHGAYFWSAFAARVAQKENVPVLIYNAAFGGTNLEHWARSSQGLLFEHGFVRANIRMPYINLYNTLHKYIPLTGVRALLADHGQNDGGEKDPKKILENYQVFIRQARADLQYPQLALVVNRQHPDNAPAVRQAQEWMLKQPDCFAGPDYDRDLEKQDKYDGIHLSASGVNKAAVLWADALTPDFFQRAKPYLPVFR